MLAVVALSYEEEAEITQEVSLNRSLTRPILFKLRILEKKIF